MYRLLEVYGDKTKHPLLTLIIVKRRHNTRFFIYNPKDNQFQIESNKSPEETNNMSIGCVIDTTIVHPYQHNFYLNSHNAYQGVNHPPLYHVLLDEIGFTPDELQLLTYYLCFTDPRSSASEAVPSVVHQADVAALNARDLFYSNNE
jgi:eukaryotic translation initiation factor 2C